MSWIHVTDFDHPQGWANASDAQQRAAQSCEQLEAGGILYFDHPPFDLPQDWRDFLLSRKQSGSPIFKNDIRPEDLPPPTGPNRYRICLRSSRAWAACLEEGDNLSDRVFHAVELDEGGIALDDAVGEDAR